MKSLRAKTYEEIASLIHESPEKHYYANGHCFSIFVDDNEFQFVENRLQSIKVQNFDDTRRIPGFQFPTLFGLEETIRAFIERGWSWNVYQDYCNGDWVVLLLPSHEVLYEFQFNGNRFQLEVIRLQTGRFWELLEELES